MLNRRLKPEQIKAIRKELRLTQEELAQELGIAVSTINRWENGKSQPGKMACKFLLKIKTELTPAGRFSTDLEHSFEK